MLFYLPLEPYNERYTALMSCPDGWAENNFKRANVKFHRVDGISLRATIKNGVVLDACGRCHYALSQIEEMVKLIDAGRVKDGDVIYVEDFWHPGIESLFYIRQLIGIDFKIGTFIHAQSVDNTDFSYAMKDWMRPIEQGFGKQYDFIFTCSDILKALCIDAGVGSENIFKSGLPYNSTRLNEQISQMGFRTPEKDNSVIFSSRFDDEKDPNFFLDLVEACPDISFKLVNPRKDRPITSNPQVLDRLTSIIERENSNLSIIDTSNKLKYYTELARAKVQFNCALQDWVSWTLLEACTYNCLPLYPIWKDFPYELKNSSTFLYKQRDLDDCRAKLYSLMNNPITEDERSMLEEVVKRHDNSWPEYLRTMNLI